MPVLPLIAGFADELVSIRHDLHANPEIGFEETRTCGIVADALKAWGLETHTGIGKTGVVGILRGRQGDGRTVGIRADMDALPMQEATDLPFRSTFPGRFHGCGHDGHTTMLLGAARYLAETRNFAGTAVLIFQPAEEGLGGARAMLADGLFSRFPCDEIYGMHNDPLGAPGTVTVKPGVAMAGATFFDITVRGAGSHAAMPHLAKDAIVVATSVVQALQSIVSRNVKPTSAAVVSVTKICAGSAYNVMPETAVVSGTIRYFDDDVKKLIHARIENICAGFEKSYDVRIEIDFSEVFDVLLNEHDLSMAYLDAAADIVGANNVSQSTELVTVSEDFADMLRVVSGAFCWLGHSGGVPLHHPSFVLDDAILPIGSSILARMVERRLPLRP
ncbi:M20 aminoacylase family protein [Mesorhizobium sp. CO1-1-8]|uniref:M20 aminoacylase family protein n=1 Tax=Mesorhizobium sp. CO1-1-8 TaxID=2876631 RepID=UPI001CD12EF2|nr:M20 aminoacylase family protein [Mesorhizobium sp. CO1-1-8]MBZ9772378.1 M20 family metallopeptidase [Mesorhizobium sp. CO1-1-8]